MKLSKIGGEKKNLWQWSCRKLERKKKNCGVAEIVGEKKSKKINRNYCGNCRKLKEKKKKEKELW